MAVCAVPRALAITLKFEEYKGMQDGRVLTAVFAGLLLLIGAIAFIQVCVCGILTTIILRVKPEEFAIFCRKLC